MTRILNEKRWLTTTVLPDLAAVLAGAAGWRFGRALAVPTVALAEVEPPTVAGGPAAVQARVPLTLAAGITATRTRPSLRRTRRVPTWRWPPSPSPRSTA